MNDLDRLQDAFLQADAAGNTEDAQLFADEIRRLSAADGSTAQGAPAPAPTAPLSDPKPPSTLERVASEIPGILGNAALETGAAAGEAVFGGWADDIFGWGASMLGKDGEAARAGYNRALDKTPVSDRVALGIVGPAALTKALTRLPFAASLANRLLGVPAGIVTGAIDGAGYGEPGDRAPMAAVGAAGGALTAVPSIIAARQASNKIAAVRKMFGDADPFLGGGGEDARRLMRGSIADSKPLHGDTLDPTRPLVGQMPVARAGKAVVDFGGENAGKVMAAADNEIATAQKNLSDAFGDLGSGALRGDAAVQAAGKGYQSLTNGRIVDLAAPDYATKVRMVAPVGDAKFAKWLTNDPILKPKIAEQAKIEAFKGLSPRNPNRVHQLQSAIGKEIESTTDPIRKGLLIQTRQKLLKELDNGVDGYTQARNQFSRTMRSEDAHKLGMAATPAKVPDALKWTPRDKAAYLDGIAKKLEDTVLPPSGKAPTPRQIIAAVNNYRPHLQQVMFNGDPKRYDAFIKAAEVEVNRMAAASAVRGSSPFPKAEREAGVIAQVVSGSIPGFLTRAAVASAAHMGEVGMLKAGRNAVKAAGRALTATDEKAIRKAIEQLGKDPNLSMAQRRLTAIIPAARAVPATLSTEFGIGRE